MKYITASLTALCVLGASTATAKEVTLTHPAQQVAAKGQALPAITNNALLDDGLRNLQHEWARIKYQVRDQKAQESQIRTLAGSAANLTAQYPGYAEPKIWQAIILSTEAGIKKGIGSLGLAKEARALLEAAAKINPNALDGSIYTSLGSLYYKVPGWPIGFGDDKKALAYLEQARAINPNGIDPNYFYGDYLMEQGKYKEAVTLFQQALQASPRAGREDADEGRRREIQTALAKAQSKMK